MKFGLSEDNIIKIKSIFSEFPEIEEVIIFGSRAKGNYKNGSDIDLALKGSNLNLKLANSISNKLDDLFLPYTFDLVIYSQIENEDLIDHIDRVGVVF